MSRSDESGPVQVSEETKRKWDEEVAKKVTCTYWIASTSLIPGAADCSLVPSHAGSDKAAAPLQAG